MTLGSVIVALVVLAIVAAIIWRMVKTRLARKDQSCSRCGSCGYCSEIPLIEPDIQVPPKIPATKQQPPN